jgi:hypothetical protein
MSDKTPKIRLETTSENIARDMAEGRFPQSSPPQMIVDAPDAWDRILNDEELRNARAALSISELRAIIKHAEDALRPQLAPSEAFAAWLTEGPKLAAAAGCHVGIKVTEAKK